MRIKTFFQWPVEGVDGTPLPPKATTNITTQDEVERGDLTSVLLRPLLWRSLLYRPIHSDADLGTAGLLDAVAIKFLGPRSIRQQHFSREAVISAALSSSQPAQTTFLNRCTTSDDDLPRTDLPAPHCAYRRGALCAAIMVACRPTVRATLE